MFSLKGKVLTYGNFSSGRQKWQGTRNADYGIVIQMFWRDHGPPHFHALYGEHEALIDIRSLHVMRGSLPRRAMALVLDGEKGSGVFSQLAGASNAGGKMADERI